METFTDKLIGVHQKNKTLPQQIMWLDIQFP